MNTESKPLAKSLHTLTVLVAVARREQAYGAASVDVALGRALAVLGYSFRADTVTDPHGIVAKARAQLNA